MSFGAPHLFWLLLVPAALLAWEIFRKQSAAANQHPKILQAETGTHSVRLSTFNSQLSTRAVRPRVLLALGLACAVVALTRPQWGRIDEPVFDQSREILIAVDLSRSMLATDVKPSRLERSKLLIRSLLEKLDGERIGLVVFSGTAFLQSPLSADYEILSEFLPAIGPDYLPEGGTNFRALIETSLAAFGTGTAADRFLIVLSDGEATDDDWKALVPDLKKKDIRVISLGVGTEAGSMIPDGAGGFVKDDRGAVVLSKLDNSSLRELAQATGGTYRDASSWLDLAEVLQSTVEAGRKGEFMEKNTVRLVERFQWALAPACLFLLLSFWLEFPVRPRPRDLKLSASQGGTGGPPVQETPATSAAAKAAVTAAALVLFVLAAPSTTRAATSTTPPKPAPAEQLSPLGKIVGRLSTKPDRTGRDWAELAGETVTWGKKIQSEQKPVPEGPVRDALTAVDLGSALDAKTADWPKLRRDLEALLEKPEDQKQQNQQQQKNDQDQNQSQDQQQQQQQQNQDSKDQKSDQQQSPQNQQQQQQQQSQSDQQKSDEQKNSDQKQDSAFGDMKDKPPPPQPHPGETQKVGGTPEKKEGDPKEAADPSLVMPLQKLDQLRNQDSPAKLFRLMEGEKKPAPGKKGKDW